MHLRLDKWLKTARIFKTRAKATAACASGRVKINGVSAKAHRPPGLNDRIEIRFSDWTRVLIVKQLLDKPVSKETARQMFEDVSEPRKSADIVERLLTATPIEREKGKGRPTKRERRHMDRVRRR